MREPLVFCLRFTGLVIALTAAWIFAGIWSTRSLYWITEDGSIPFLSCVAPLMSSKYAPEGDYCKVDLLMNGEVRNLLAIQNSPFSRCSVFDEDMTCYYRDRCSDRCVTTLGEPCPVEFGVDGRADTCIFEPSPSNSLTIACNRIAASSYCDSRFSVTASKMQVVRRVGLGGLSLLVLWLASEISLFFANRNLKQKRKVAITSQQTKVNLLKNSMRAELENIWTAVAKSKKHEKLLSSDPRKRFAAAAWSRTLALWRTLRGVRGRNFQQHTAIRSIFLYLFFLILLTSAMAIVQSAGGSCDSQVWRNLWKNMIWLDFLIYSDVLLDIGLFLIAVFTQPWPNLKLSQKSENTDDSFSSAESSDNQLSSIDCFPVCLLIAAHESCMNVENREIFTTTLKNALEIFPASSIFVCDNGSSLSPVDETWGVVKQIHPEINYLYIPEGNKTLAFYWTCRYWLPLLESEGRIRNFRFVMLIDDDVPLPVDMIVPIHLLEENPEIKAVHIPLAACEKPGNFFSMILQWQDLEYKLAAAHKLLQSKLGRALSCHGAVSLWNRETLGKVFYHHDTVFHGEDLYMGLSLLRFRDSSRIVSYPNQVVPTYAPDTWLSLFRQRVQSWDLTSHKKTFSYLTELLAPSSFTHKYSLILKPYILQELLTIALDWLRVFLLVSLAIRNWRGLLMMTLMFAGILYFQLLVHQLVFLRRRPELRSPFFALLLFPVYRLANLVFRVCALCHNVLVYAHMRKATTIGFREDEVHDIPPVPPHPDVDWFNIWLREPVAIKSVSTKSSIEA